MGARAVLPLLLVTLLTAPGSSAEPCGEGEYLYEGHCCVLCPAGYYVSEHCSAPHTKGTCLPCTDGKSYTAHANGLEECLLCRQCKDDQMTLRACTQTRDTECQCKQGYFCPAEGCEICQRCSQTCPEGKEIVQNCNATTDLGCGLPDQGHTSGIWIAAVTLFAVGTVVLMYFVIRKWMCDKASTDKEQGLASEDSIESLILSEVKILANNAAHPDSENSGEGPEGQAQISVDLEVKSTSPEENGAVPSESATIPQRSLWCRTRECWKKVTNPSSSSKPRQNPAFHQNDRSKVLSGRIPANHMVKEGKYQITVKDLSQKELRDCFLAFIKQVPVKKWRQLMRTHLKENCIDNIIYGCPNDIEEQSYQMLLMWKNTLGEKQSIIKLLDELWCLDTKAYNNVVNTLKSNSIISKIEATD